MAFDIIISDSEEKTVNEVSFSHGVLAFWAEVGRDKKLPMITRMYEQTFSDGFSAYDQELVDLMAESVKLKTILESDGHKRVEEDNG